MCVATAVVLVTACSSGAKKKHKGELQVQPAQVQLGNRFVDDEPTEGRLTLRNSGKGQLRIVSVTMEDSADDDATWVVRTDEALPKALNPVQFVTARVKLDEGAPAGTYATHVVVTYSSAEGAAQGTAKVPVSLRVMEQADCASDNPCVTATFDRLKNRCVRTPASGDNCDDGDDCTEDDTCSNGQCLGKRITEGECGKASAACQPGECDDAPVPERYLGKDGRLREDWREQH